MRAWFKTCQVLLLVCLTLLLAGAGPASVLAAGRFALIIGNSEYENVPRLPNAANDARDLAAALEKLGFNVDLGVDLKRTEFSNLVSDFRAKVKAANARDAVFFYAGHGFSLNGLNHLVPVDAALKRKDIIPYETLQLDEVISSIQASPGQQTIIFLDACRNNPLPQKLQDESTTDGLAQLESTTDGIFVAFATTPGKVTRDGKGKNSPFTTALLKHIGEPNESVSRLLIKVRTDVKKATGGEQIPWTQESLSADFFFNPGAVEIASAELQPSQPEPKALADTPDQPQVAVQPECPFGCDENVPADNSTKTSGPAATDLPASDVAVASESAGQEIEGRVIGDPGQSPDQQSVSTDSPPSVPAAAETQGEQPAVVAGNGPAVPDAPETSGDQVDGTSTDGNLLKETEIASLNGDDVVRSAPASADSPPAAASPADAGSVLDGTEAAPADAVPSGAALEGTEIVPVEPDAAPGANELSASQGAVIEGKVQEPAAEPAANVTDAVPATQGAVIEDKVQEPVEAPAVDVADAVPASQGTVIEGKVQEPVSETAQPQQKNYDVAALPPGNTTVEPGIASGDLALQRDIQEQLQRVGCFSGQADGNWSQQSRDALGEYFKRKDRPAGSLEPSGTLLSDLKAEPDVAVCVAAADAPPKKVTPDRPRTDKPKPSKPKSQPVKSKPQPQPPPAKPKPQPVKPKLPKTPPIFVGG